MIKIKILTECMTIHCSFNMYKSKVLYWYKQENLTHRFYDDDCFNSKYFDLKKDSGNNVIKLKNKII